VTELETQMDPSVITRVGSRCTSSGNTRWCRSGRRGSSTWWRFATP
jgi:hypothetical protein